jgi:hypothetical protein
MEDSMKSRKSTSSPASWVVDYSAARARAIKRLGDRYLLARPINASRNDPRQAGAFAPEREAVLLPDAIL